MGRDLEAIDEVPAGNIIGNCYYIIIFFLVRVSNFRALIMCARCTLLYVHDELIVRY